MGDADRYVLAVVGRHRVAENGRAERVRRRLLPLLARWAGDDLEGVSVAGSYAKGTAIRNREMFPGDFDIDLFVSLRPETTRTLAEIQESLAEFFRGYSARARNVAVRIQFDGVSVDLVAGRRRARSADHTLWQHRFSTWIQTNIGEQGRFVRASGAAVEILATKVWRRRNELRFPSYCLELAVIRGLAGLNPLADAHGSVNSGRDPVGLDAGGPAARFLGVLEFLANGFGGARIADPANSNNVVSDSMTEEEKARIAEAARVAVRAERWDWVIG